MNHLEDQFDRVVWSKSSMNDLNDIEDFYIKKGWTAEKVFDHLISIIDTVEETVFSKQWQIDEYDTSVRRIIVSKKYRVLYKIISRDILITAVYPSRKYPNGFIKD